MKDMLRELARDKEVPPLIASMPASAQQRRIAFGVVIFLSAAFAMAMPFATIQAVRVNGFLQVTQSMFYLPISLRRFFCLLTFLSNLSVPFWSRKRLYVQRPVRVFANA